MRSRAMPSYQRQRGRSKDRAFVRLNGRRHYLGEYGSPESKEAYRRLIVEWAIDAGAGLSTSSDLTVVELIAHFWKHAQSYYRRLDGTPTTEIGNFRLALRPLKELYGRTPADAFGPKAQQVIKPFLADRPVDACLFSAAEAEATRRTEAHRRRKSHPSSGHSPGTNRKRHPKQTPRICRVEVVS